MTDLDKMARELLADKIFQRDSGCFALSHIIRRGEDHLVSSGSAVAAISDALRKAGNGWVSAVDHELVGSGIGIADLNDSVDEAARKLSLLIDWHVAVATDPAVNGGYVLVPVEAGEKEIETMAYAIPASVPSTDAAKVIARRVRDILVTGSIRAHNE